MTTPLWWQDAIAYQIYPRSFKDTNGDGIGDLPGIIEKLDYLQWLGVTALWLSPFYPSPQFDVGYDVADYTEVGMEYGTLADFDKLLTEAHRRGIHILLDLVLNHTSHQHPWFLESKSSRDNPKRDWYVWRSGKKGGPPNDWEAFFGGPAWEYDPTTDQYYYHFFLKEQPDLNWRNPEVRQAILDVMRFWYERGVDGFRIDAIDALFEDAGYRDSTVKETLVDLWFKVMQSENPDWRIFEEKFAYQFMVPENIPALRQIRQFNDTFPDRLLLGETDSAACYGDGSDMLHSMFSFDITNVNTLDAAKFRTALRKRMPQLPVGAWECNTLGNHDRPRAMSSFADGKHDKERMAVALALVMFLWGTPMLYNGEEIGMHNLPITRLEDLRDRVGIWAYHQLVDHGMAPAEAWALADKAGRDKERTPMQWANTPLAGFSTDGATPWLPVHPNYADGVNVADQMADDSSLLHKVRALAHTRQKHIALRRGDFELLDATGDVFAFWRRHDEQTLFVALNMADAPSTVKVAAPLQTVYSSHPRADSAQDKLELAPYEIYVGQPTGN